MTDDEIREALRAAWEAGFEAADKAAFNCCGCNCYGSDEYENPYAPEEPS